MKRILLGCFVLTFMLLSIGMSAQERTVSGKVTGADDGLPLPQVSVYLKGSPTTGIPTGADGNYRLSVPSQGAVLVFRFLGFITQEIEVGNQTVINVPMQVDVTSLDEVVVTAQGIARDKKSLGYAIGQIDKELLEARPESDAAVLLRGKVAGVQVSTSGGFLGRQANIQIRGASSVNGDNNALVVVDGVYYDFNRFQDIDPNNIADITVLKGLAASALYGQEGRNGVLLVTTKTSQAGQNKEAFSMTVNQQFVMNQVGNLPDYQNTYGQGSDNNANVTFVGNWGARFDSNITVPGHYATGRVPGLDVVFPDLQGDVPYQAFPDNVNDFFQDSWGTNTSVNLSANVGKTSIGFNTGFVDQEGYIPENNLRRFTLGTSITSQLTDKLNLSTTFNYSENDQRNPTSGIFDRLVFLPRNLDIQGLPYQNPLTGGSVYYRPDLENPLWQLDNIQFKDVRRGFFGKVGLTYDINDKMSIGYRLGLDSYNTVGRNTVNKGGLSNQGIGSMATFNDQRLTFDHNILFNANEITITPDLILNATAGARARSINSEFFGINSTNQVVFNFFRHGNFETHQPTGNGDSRVNNLSVYGQAAFEYKDFLFVTLSGANDWGSQVETENRSLFYPSASVSFIPTAVWDGLRSDVISSLKVRASYGTSAGYPGSFQTRAVLSANAQAFVTLDGQNVSTNAVSSFRPNPDLLPERVKEYELGLDAKLFDYRVAVDLSIYQKISEDQVLRRSLPASTGFTSTVINAGRIDTKGLEASITVYPIKSNNFTWTITNNFNAYEVTAIDLPEEFINYANGLNYAIEGQPLGVFRLDYVVRDAQGRALINPDDGTIIGSGEAGLPDRVVGDPNPDFTYTVINGMSYKNFNLNIQVDYTHGGDIYSSTVSNTLRRGTTVDTEDREGTYIIPGILGDPTTGEPILDEAGNTIPNRIQLGANDLYFINTMDVNENLVFDGTVLRVREINLSYTLPTKLVDKSPFKAVSLSFNAQNLWYKAFNFPPGINFDPEVSSGSGNGRGFDTQSDPTRRQFSLAIRLTL
ncbi:MAG: TonB-linked SusC/RagA family outer membrane protein [Roseivirga sp.]|jgi:TonB-linked SusC/RagA family outer membrane protein